MALYFVCSAEATVTSNTVQCSTAITTVDPSASQLITQENADLLINGLFSGVTLILVFWLIKQAIDI